MAIRRLFEQGSDVTPDLTFRVASGKAGSTEENSSWQTVVTWLEGVLNFLKISNNLSDLNDPSVARTNLDVYDTTTIDTALGFKADKTNVLEKDNTTSYTPTSSFHPSTKDYRDKLQTSSLSNAGGTSSGGAATLTINARVIQIAASNSNRFYKLPVPASSNLAVTIKAKDGNSQDVAVVTDNTDLTVDLPLAQRDSISFVSIGSEWVSISYTNNI